MLTADRASRTLTADPLLPFGEEGRTNLGRVTASKGTVTIPEDVSGMFLNLQHEATARVAKFTSVTETPTGLRATFHVPNTRAGDDLLAEVEEGMRTGVSVEIDNPVIRDGQLLSGALTGAAAVVDPAFPSAQLTASDVGELDEDDDEETTDDEEPSDDAAEAADEEADVADTTTAVEADEKTEPPVAASLPRSIKAKATKPEPSLFAQLAGADPSGREVIKARLNAALDQAIATDLAPSMVQQWLGEVTTSQPYQRRYVPLFNHGSLTGRTAIGWRFKAGSAPQVATYAGYPTQPNSNVVQTESVTMTAAMIAGAGEVDRAWLDFPVPEFWAGYYRECNSDYDRKLDAAVLASAVTGATAVTNSAALNPANVSRAACQIVDGAIAIINAERGLPSFAVVGSDLYRSLLLTRADDVLEYLSMALGLDKGDLKGFSILPSASATLTAKVLVGARESQTVYELPGASPTRIDAVNLTVGGVQTGVIGYHAEIVNDALSLALVSQVA